MLSTTPEFRNRQRLLRILRDPTTQQCSNWLGTYMEDYGPVCYMGAIIRAMRQAGEPLERYGDPDVVCTWAGTNNTQHWKLVDANDYGASLPSIANKLEALPFSHTSTTP